MKFFQNGSNMLSSRLFDLVTILAAVFCIIHYKKYITINYINNYMYRFYKSLFKGYLRCFVIFGTPVVLIFTNINKC